MLAGLVAIEKAIEGRGLAAIDAKGWKFSALAEQEHIGSALRQRRDFIDGPEPAAMQSGPAGIRTQRPRGETNGIK